MTKSPKFNSGDRVTLISDTGKPMYTGTATRSPFHLDRVVILWDKNPVKNDKARGAEFHSNTGVCKDYKFPYRSRIRLYAPEDEEHCSIYQKRELDRQGAAWEQDFAEKEELIHKILSTDMGVWEALSVQRLRSWHGELRICEADILKRS